jgi:hypothetical protein
LRLASRLLPFAALAVLAGSLPPNALASERVELAVGVRTNRIVVTNVPDPQLALGIEGSWQPRRWPIAVTGYAAGAGEWYQGQTGEYPGSDDGVTAHHRFLYGAAGIGLQKTWFWGRTRISVAGGPMVSTTGSRESFADWKRSRNQRANGEWLRLALSRRVGERFDYGVRARYTWERYSSPENEWLKAGGVEVGLMLGFGSVRN